MTNKKIEIDENDLIDLLYWARRYCDNRSTYAPSRFNKIYNKIRNEYPDFIIICDKFDSTLKNNGIYWPYAQDDKEF